MDLLKLSPYVRFRFDNSGNLLVGSGSLSFTVLNSEYLTYFISFCENLKTGITIKEIDLITERYPEQLKQIISDFVKDKRFFLNHEHNSSYRYSRHHLYYNLVDPNVHPETIQLNLNNAHVLILGCGGIGNLVATSLAASGVGNLYLCDYDIIEESNLTRQIMYNTEDIGSYKIDVLAKKIRSLNHNVKVRTIRENSYDFVKSNNPKYSSFDFIVLSADSPSDIIFATSEYAKRLNVAFMSIGYIQDLAVYGPLVTPDMVDSFKIKYKSYVPRNNIDVLGELNKNYQAPSFGPLNMFVSGLASLEIVKYLGRYGTNYCFDKRIGINPNTLTIQEQRF